MRTKPPKFKISAILVLAAPIIAGALCASAVHTQSAATPLPCFEVVSIKPDPVSAHYIGTHIDMGLVGTTYVATGVTAKDLILFAYGIEDFQLSGGPAWINADKYAIDAKIDDASFAAWQKLPADRRTGELFELMFHSLLADRFQLKVSHHSKELPVFALLVAKNGPKLSPAQIAPATSDGAAPKTTQVRPGSHVSSENGSLLIAVETQVPLSTSAKVLSRQPEFGGRQVLDETGLAGNYTFTLRWTRQVTSANNGQADGSAADSSAASIWTAVQEQLGLKLKSSKAPVDTIIIDHIEKPTPN
jgi:uncharacterized protein (TIGR03435 family)